MNKQTKIDFHTHILPNTDDGAESPQMAAAMLSMLAQQQVDTVVLTPHYYSHRESIEDFIERREQAFQRLKDVYSDSFPALHVGAEVYFTEYLFNNNDLTPLCIDGTNTMLIELPYNKTIDDKMIDRIDRLTAEYLITPVLAHIERYPTLFKYPKTLDKLLDIGCFFQINLSSFTVFRKKRLLSLVKEGYIGALGTDSHNMSSRDPDYNAGYNRLVQAVSNEDLQTIQNAMKQLLKPC